jgi:hypothetical protein
MAGQPIGDLPVSAQLSGSCESGSDSVGNAEVYRCMSANDIYDPCWADAAGGVLCMESPWATSVVHLAAPGVPPGVDVSTTDLGVPWGVELSMGAQCLAAQGAHDTFDGQTVDYYCTGGTIKNLELLRGVDRTNPYWTYQTAYYNSSGKFAGPTVTVATAWFAGPAPPTDVSPCPGQSISVTASLPSSSGSLVWLVFQNDSTSTCSLIGYPGVAALNSSGNQVMQIARSSASEGASITDVFIPAGGAASAVLNGDPDFPNGSCPTYNELLVTPPNTTSSRAVSASGVVICANAGIEPVGASGTPLSWS